ncbi:MULTISPECIES: alkaline phosphatase family protein [unclassified Bradyrhizobium]|uniref:alkaline phosphatase family protein n=1 Tax=unclassified Bradyrhizobium TaxID=2631580 RepID=UPI001BA467BD|nr:MULTISPECIES: nucleotide pyrophosphatase/phosphodiesterase family protein [unclassified Bradyrhizobium]MBR1228498.1 alkaline phosphatase family protein [Bradyrhizobium sp. AUGA SZCCT0176]MBR1297248.1 alkaline phosphatase family protein [Bradyrhizobium sp. AUGA SZCCT0042]
MMKPSFVVAIAAAIAATAASPAAAGKATLNLVLVLDGLRPDSITEQETPNLWRLREEGVNFPNGHAVFPTVTRANAAAIGTGVYPDRNGIFGNRLYVRQVDPNRAFNNDNHKNLLHLDAVTGERMVLTKTLGEILAERGKTLAVVSSGSTGSALLVNPRAPKGVGVLVNADWEPGVRVAFPDNANEAILRRFPAAPKKGGAKDPYLDQVSWTGQVLRDYVLPELKPDVIVNWLTEPDHVQHAAGAGSTEARAAIRHDDREVGLVLDRLRELGLIDKTNIIVVSDHGFGHGIFGVNVADELIKAGLKLGPDSDDVVLASSGQTMSLHVRDRNPERIGAIVSFLQRQQWVGVLFTAGKPGGSGVPVEGQVPGTFALELVHLANSERGPDIVFTFPWSSAKSPSGVSGSDYTEAATTGPLTGTAGNHGSMSPWTVRNTFLAWGADFKRGVTVRTPSSNVDLAPTLLALMNLDSEVDLSRFDGRPLREAFAGGPDEEQVPIQVKTYFVKTDDDSYRAALQLTELDRQRYIDKSWRMR